MKRIFKVKKKFSKAVERQLLLFVALRYGIIKIEKFADYEKHFYFN